MPISVVAPLIVVLLVIAFLLRRKEELVPEHLEVARWTLVGKVEYKDEMIRMILISDDLNLTYSYNTIFVRGFVGEYIQISSSKKRGKIQIGFSLDGVPQVLWLGKRRMTYIEPKHLGWLNYLRDEIHQNLKTKT